MSDELVLGFFLGMISAFLTEYVIYLFKSKVYDTFLLRKKYKHLTGRYKHSNGEVKLVHLHENFFQASGTEDDNVKWTSMLTYHGNSTFSGVYDWKPASGLNDWGEHYLHVLPNDDISVIWINKSTESESKGRVIWKKIE